MKTTELICKKVHTPWPNVRIPANTKISIGPDWLVEAICARGFFEVAPKEVALLPDDRKVGPEEGAIAAEKPQKDKAIKTSK